MNTSTEQEFGSLLIVNLTKALQDTNLGNDCVCWIAEAAKDPDARNDANQIGALQKLLELLEIAMTRREEEFVKNSLRALANLCFDHDDNRDEILEIENGIHKIVSCLDLGFANLDLTTFGALLNISMENELVQTLMVKEGLIVKIFEHLKPLQTKIPESELGRETICMAIKVTSSILESDSGLLEFFNMDGPSLFSTIIKTLMLELNPSSPILDWIIQTMDAISLVLETLSIKEESQIKITNSSLFPTILEFVQVGFGDDNIDNLKLSFCKVICIVTMADGNMKSLVNDTNVISTFKAWTLKTNFSIKLDDEVRMTGALCLGNIARSGKFKKS